jgi:hypothetical protein
MTLSTSAGSLSSVAYSYTGFTRYIWDCNGEEACGSAAVVSAGEIAVFNAQKQWVFLDNYEIKNTTYPVDRGTVTITAYNATTSTSVTFTATNTFATGQILTISGFTGTGTQFNGKPVRVTAASGSSFTGTPIKNTDTYSTGSGSDTGTAIVSAAVRNGIESSCGTAATPTNFHASYGYYHAPIIPVGVKNIIRMNFAKSLDNCAAGSSNGTTYQYNTCDMTDETGGHGGDCFVTADIADSNDAINAVGMFNGQFNQITNSNLLHMRRTSLDVGDHCDMLQHSLYSGTTFTFAGNVVADDSDCIGGTIIGPLQLGQASTNCPTCTAFIHDNVIFNVHPTAQIIECGGHTQINDGICYIYNNSAASASNQTFAATALTPTISVVYYANNYFTTTNGTSPMCTNQGGSGSACNPVGTHNLQQSTAVATASPNTPGGYTTTGVGGYALAAGGAGWSTVGTGDTKATLDGGGMNTSTPSSDTGYGGLRVTSTRPASAAWDIGAFQFGVSPWTITVSCQGTANGTIKEPVDGSNINAVCTAGVASGTTFASYVNGTAVTLVGASTSGTFIGWTDALCSSFVTANCTFNAGSSPTITAAFQLVPTNTLSCSPCNVNLGTSVTLTTTVANMQSPATIDDGWTITDPNGDQVNNGEHQCRLLNGWQTCGSSRPLTTTLYLRDRSADRVRPNGLVGRPVRQQRRIAGLQRRRDEEA